MSRRAAPRRGPRAPGPLPSHPGHADDFHTEGPQPRCHRGADRPATEDECAQACQLVGHDGRQSAASWASRVVIRPRCIARIALLPTPPPGRRTRPGRCRPGPRGHLPPQPVDAGAERLDHPQAGHRSELGQHKLPRQSAGTRSSTRLRSGSGSPGGAGGRPRRSPEACPSRAARARRARRQRPLQVRPGVSRSRPASCLCPPPSGRVSQSLPPSSILVAASASGRRVRPG